VTSNQPGNLSVSFSTHRNREVNLPLWSVKGEPLTILVTALYLVSEQGPIILKLHCNMLIDWPEAGKDCFYLDFSFFHSRVFIKYLLSLLFHENLCGMFLEQITRNEQTESLNSRRTQMMNLIMRNPSLLYWLSWYLSSKGGETKLRPSAKL